jgi:hypothetical protein
MTKKPTNLMRNQMFCKLDKYFKKACELAKIKPTPRQASKFRMGKGSAVQFKRVAIHIVNQERINKTEV